MGAPTGKREHVLFFSGKAIQFCVSLKCPLSQPLRRMLDMVQSLLQLASLEWLVRDLSTICRHPKALLVQL